MHAVELALRGHLLFTIFFIVMSCISCLFYGQPMECSTSLHFRQFYSHDKPNMVAAILLSFFFIDWYPVSTGSHTPEVQAFLWPQKCHRCKETSAHGTSPWWRSLTKGKHNILFSHIINLCVWNKVWVTLILKLACFGCQWRQSTSQLSR